MKYSLEYLSIGCNKISGCSDWGKNGIFLYCGHRSIVLYKPEDYKPLLVLNGHEKRVNTVKWIPNGSLETEIVSGGADSQNKIETILKDNKGSITSLACLYIEDTKTTYIASTSSESLVVIWEKKDKEWKKFSTINFGKKMMEVCSFGVYKNTIFLACGGLDDKIHLFVKDETEFTKKCVLSGHQDWIRCLDFNLKQDGLYLASGSQDTKIRLWKISKDLKHTVYEDKEWSISLEALLIGHEEWVHTVKWHPSENKIISSSMDRSMIIWEPEKSTGIWMNTARMGEFGGLSGLFGQLGYFGCHFSPDGKRVLSHGYNGSFHLWESDKGWKPRTCISGHFSDVMDISWDPSKNYFMSVSLDQTCRLFSYFEKTKTWHEIARPQVHGYDLNCFTFIKNTEHKFVSGADEKVIRVFEAPQTFLSSLENISGIKSDKSIERPVGASVPQLGLSNKGVSEEVKETEENVGFKPIILEQPPLEDDLLQNTLWPEVQKLYGHANEIYAIACSNNGKWIASACKSKKIDQAQIIIWDTSSWKQVQSIKSHSLTVSQICFSPNDQYLASVSRDRTVFLYKYKDGLFEIVKSVEAGERIIWGCSFSDDGKYLLTGSRDGMLKLFDLELNLVKSLTTKESITSVEFLPNSHDFSVGFENGGISIYSFEKELLSFDSKDCAFETIRRLKWRKFKDHLELLVCSTDHTIRLYHVFE